MEFKNGFLVDDWSGEIKIVSAALIENLEDSYSTYKKAFLIKTETGYAIVKNNADNVCFKKDEADKISQRIKLKVVKFYKNQIKEYSEKLKVLEGSEKLT